MERYEKPEMEVIVFDEEEIHASFDPGNGLSGDGIAPNQPNSF